MRRPALSGFLCIFVSLSLSWPSLGAGAALDGREAKARDYLTQRVSRESGGSLELTKFAKTNGYEKTLDGSKTYVLEWSADLVAKQEIWKPGNAIVGHWESFAVFDQQPGPWDTLLTGGAAHFEAGMTFRLTGNTLFRLTDLGWRAEGLTVVSSKAIADTPKANSKSPFAGTWNVIEQCGDCMKSEQALRISEMNSGLFKLDKGHFEDGRPIFPSQLEVKYGAPAPITLRLTDGMLAGVTNETGVPNPVRVQLAADGELTYFVGDFTPKKGPRVP